MINPAEYFAITLNGAGLPSPLLIETAQAWWLLVSLLVAAGAILWSLSAPADGRSRQRTSPGAPSPPNGGRRVSVPARERATSSQTYTVRRARGSA